MTVRVINKTERITNRVVNLSIVTVTMLWILISILDLSTNDSFREMSAFLFLILASALVVGIIAGVIKLFLGESIELEPDDVRLLSINIPARDFIDKNYEKLRSQGNRLYIGATSFELTARETSFMLEILKDKPEKITRNEIKVTLFDEPAVDLFKSAIHGITP